MKVYIEKRVKSHVSFPGKLEIVARYFIQTRPLLESTYEKAKLKETTLENFYNQQIIEKNFLAHFRSLHLRY